MTEKMTVTFYRKELTWYGYEAEVEATSNEEAMEKIKDYDYKHIDTTAEECDSVEGYGVFYFPDGTEVDERDYPLKESSNRPRDKFSYLQAQHTRRKGLGNQRDQKQRV